MRNFGILIVVVLVTVFLCPASAEESFGQPVDESLLAGPATRYNVELAGAKDSVKLAKLKSGETVFIVKRLGAGTDRLLTPAEFADLLYRQRSTDGWLNTIFNISSPMGLAWVALGLGGQLLFTGRMLVQWISSEKSRKSVVPVAFWWMSLIGATMLLVYFIWRRDIVGILGQATGWLIYIRNLVLIHKNQYA
ncbi:MAG: lipid-A-disaccharide synthase N-terminal domain-containing protein [Terrimicrobiaceae bacterium]